MRKTKGLILLLLGVICLTARAHDDDADWKRLDKEGRKQLERNDFAKAKESYLKAATIGEKLGPNDERYASSFRSLGYAAQQVGEFSMADFGYTRALQSDEMRLGSNDIVVAYDLMSLADVAGYGDEFLRCDEALDRARPIVEMKIGKYSAGMGIWFASRGSLEMKEGHAASAETNFLKALELLPVNSTFMPFSGANMRIIQSYFKPSQTATAYVYNNLGLVQRTQKKYADSERSLLQAIKMFEYEYGKKSLHLVNSFHNLSLTYKASGDLPKAEAASRRALALVSEVDPANPTVQGVRHVLGEILTAEGKLDEAKKYAE